jgi:hypothetical protein
MATSEQYADWIVRNKDKRGTPEFETVAQAYRLSKEQTKQPITQIDPGIRSAASDSSLENFAAGVGKAFVDVGRGVGSLIGIVDGEDIKESRRLDKDLMNTKAGFGGNIAGNVGMALAPGGVLKGASMAARSIPAISGAAPALSAAGSAVLAPRSISGAAAVGSGLGFVQPAEDIQERLGNTAIGGVATGIVPAIGAAYRTTKSALEPFYAKGQQQIIARALRSAAGGQADDVTRTLSQAAEPFTGPAQPGQARSIMGEIVPGSVPTTGQASGNAGIASLERAALASNPNVTATHAARMVDQNAARVAALTDIAGTDGARAFAAANRDATADQLYKQAIEKGVDISRDASTGAFLSKAAQAGRKGEITKLMQRPAIQAAMKDARRLAANEGVNLTNPAGSVKGLDYVKRALDDQIGAAHGNEQRILVELKKRLLTTIDTLSPEYAAARQTFQQMSGPINQMDVAGAVADKSINKLTGQIQPQAYARALTDQTAQSATGFKKATLEGVLDPQQLGRMTAIKDDLARAVAAQNAGRGAGSDTVQKLAYSNILNQAGVPNFMRNLGPAQIVGNIASRGADAAYGRANQELSTMLAQTLMSPEETVRILSSVDPGQRRLLMAEILRRGALAGGMSTPALVNAQQ